jgi:hypothetical protein
MTHRNITTIRESDLPVQFQTAAMYHDLSPAKVAAFKAHCKANGIFYYARPREDFSTWEAFELAEQAGCRQLLMEDMS